MALGVVLGMPILLDAHHSFSTVYLQDRKITIQGRLTQFYFRNPHSFLVLDISKHEGEPIHWMAEWDAGGQLGRLGITRDTLHPGDQLVIQGNPTRNARDHRVRMLRVFRPSDGWKWVAPAD